MEKKTREIIILSAIMMSFGVLDYVLHRYSIAEMLSARLMEGLSGSAFHIVIITMFILGGIFLCVSIMLNRKENQREDIRLWIIILIVIIFYVGGIISFLAGRIFMKLKFNL